jgi:lycopene beta-cyclase
MSYLTFHLIFILPPLLLLLLTVIPRARRRFGARAVWTLPALAAIAFIYTTPWDNYLVYRGVWWYGADRVIGTIGYVPVEEYLFFLLQPLLTGAWTYMLLLRDPGLTADTRVEGVIPRPKADAAAAARSAQSASGATAGLLLPAAGPRALGIALYLLLAAAGMLALTWTSGLYLGLILVWAAPVLLAQWYFIAGTAAKLPVTFTAAVAVPTLYLWVADRIAIGLGIWSIAPEYTTGLHLVGLPVEEAIFFLVTNLLVVQGVLLFVGPVMWRAAVPAARHAVAA